MQCFTTGTFVFLGLFSYLPYLAANRYWGKFLLFSLLFFLDV